MRYELKRPRIAFRGGAEVRGGVPPIAIGGLMKHVGQARPLNDCFVKVGNTVTDGGQILDFSCPRRRYSIDV